MKLSSEAVVMYEWRTIYRCTDTCGHVTSHVSGSPSASCLSTKLDILVERVQHVWCAGFCQDICQLFLSVDVFNRDIALLNLLVKPVILGKKMAVLARVVCSSFVFYFPRRVSL